MAKQFDTTNPATGESISTFTYMSDAEAKSAVEACHCAFEKWRGTPLSERATVIKRIGASLGENEDKLAQMMTNEMGKLLEQSREEVGLCSAICEWTAANGPDELASEERELQDGQRGIIAHAPIGVVFGIQPWNFPAYQVVRYAIANLMAGNGVLLKHAANVTGSAKLLETIFRDAGLPEHLFTVLIITHDQSDDIIGHDNVRGVTLTGSPGAGRHVAALAGKALKKTVMELGSNDAYIVLNDADLELAVEKCVQGRTYNNGETCIAAKRFIVEAGIYDKFRDAFVAEMKKIRIGDPTDEDSDMGPMAREDLRDDLHHQVQESVEKGARLLCGGAIPERAGYYYPATVLENVLPGQPAYEDELFGPVAALIRATDAHDAMRIANDSRFGLGGGIFTKDIEKAVQMASHEFDTGMVFINGFGLATPNMPFGGVKNSGYGREHGGFGLKEFVNHKAVLVMS